MTDNIVDILHQAGIKPSQQRIKIAEYLLMSDRHPSAEDVFHELKKTLPTLSLATVYNTLHILAEKGLVRALATNQPRIRYDFESGKHGHFVCEQCARIYDFALVPTNAHPELEGFQVNSEDVVLRGICNACLHDKHQ